MKRVFDEISDDEWGRHKFNTSRVFGKMASQRCGDSRVPRAIESFAFGANRATPDEDDCVEVAAPSNNGNVKKSENDDRVDAKPLGNRSRRFVVDDDDVDDEDIGTNDEEDELTSDEEDEEDLGEDVVGKALQKCAKISSDLKEELYGSAATECDRYAEVEEVAPSVRIVTQNDVDEACSVEDSNFRPTLKPYQLVGVNFLLLLNKKRIGGAILADEMGLGKTIQAITYLMLLKHFNNDPGPHLIVCPASVLENWERELKKWCPKFVVIQFHGSMRAAYAKKLSKLAKSGLPPPFNVLLVCYTLFERHSAQQKDDRKILRRWKWSCVLMDEAHALKDKNSYRWKNLMSIARNANQRLMLTGTPLQNDLHELWSMLEFMLPDLFATEDVDLKKLLNGEDRDLISHMKSILGPFILRRLKSDVMKQLVQKIQRVEYVPMEKVQEDAYKEAIEQYRAFSNTRPSKASNNKSKKVNETLPQRQIANYFTQFRKIANHPLLIRRDYSDNDVIKLAKKFHRMGAFGHECTQDRVVEELKGYNDFAIHKLLLNYGFNDTKGTLSDDHALLSGKARALAKLLPALKKDGHRVLIFSQWTSMLDILEWILDVIGVSYCRLDGSTQVTERQSIVDTFNSDPSIFACLLSTRAGGQGLNLTGADTVVIHDMDFNPQIDRQAEDRCHRIGQTKAVTIYRLVTRGTVDENVYQIAQRKLVLDAAVLESGVEYGKEGDNVEKTMGEILSSLLIG